MSATAKLEDVVAQGWEVRPLGEVVKPTRPRIKPSEKPDLPFIGMEHVEAHTMKLLGTVPAGSMKSSAVHFQPGDVLYGRLRPYLNKVYRPDFEGLCSAEFIVFPKAEGLDSRYLQYFLNSSAFVKFASHLNTGDRPRVDFDQLAPYEFPVAPLDQQKRIVAEIEKQFSRLDEAVANLKRVKASLKRYKAAVLKAAVEGRLVAKANEFGRVPLQKLIGRIRQGWSPKCDLNREPGPDEWAVITTTAVQPMLYVDGQGKPLPDDLEPRPQLEVKNGDFLVTRKGPRVRAGVACLVRRTRHRLMVCDTVYRFRCDESKVLPEYLEIALNAPSVVNAIDRQKAGINESGVSLTHAKLGGIEIPVPSLEEQSVIVAEVDRRLSLLRETESQMDANLQRAERLRQSVLGHMFAPTELGRA